VKNLLIISVALLVGCYGFGQTKQPKQLGIGFAVANNGFQYEDVNSNYSSFYKNKELTTKITTADSIEIYPFFYKPDYGLYHFICLEYNDNYIKVLINDSNIAYISNDSNFTFQTWGKMLGSASLERITNNNPIRSDIGDENDVVTYTCKFERFKAKKFVKKGNEYWVYVAFDTDCKDYPTSKTNWKFGWIKWRINNQLLVDISLLC
jgi:hypothetical protein